MALPIRNGKGQKKFKCSTNIFMCKLPGRNGGNTFKCWVGKNKDFDCKPIPKKQDEFICKPKGDDGVFKCAENVIFEPKKPPKPECPKHPHVEG